MYNVAEPADFRANHYFVDWDIVDSPHCCTAAAGTASADPRCA